MSDILHYAECELFQKLLVANIFPRILLIGNIFVTKYATTVKKYFFGATMPGKSVGIYGYGQFSTLICVIFQLMQSLRKNSNMIRPSISETQHFYIIKLHIFEKFSLRAFEWHVAWCQKWRLSKNIRCRDFSWKAFNWQYLSNKICYTIEKIFFWI